MQSWREDFAVCLTCNASRNNCSSKAAMTVRSPVGWGVTPVKDVCFPPNFEVLALSIAVVTLVLWQHRLLSCSPAFVHESWQQSSEFVCAMPAQVFLVQSCWQFTVKSQTLCSLLPSRSSLNKTWCNYQQPHNNKFQQTAFGGG